MGECNGNTAYVACREGTAAAQDRKLQRIFTGVALMGQTLDVHRLHFAFTVTFHYIFPQLTMGLALLLVYLKTKALRTGDEHYNRAARFWARIFGINFALGVVTGIPMEFQFGTELPRPVPVR